MPRRKRLAPASTVLLLLLVPATGLASKVDKQQRRQDAANEAHAAQIEAAKSAAATWLSLIDAGKYADAWQQTSPFLQSHFPKADWEKHLNAIRKPLDPFIDRSLSTTQYRELLPGLPPGQYVALVWESYFGAKHQMLESVILGWDGTSWKPVGYAVQ